MSGHHPWPPPRKGRPPTDAELLERALALYEVDGYEWIQGGMGDVAEKTCCVGGAVDFAYRDLTGSSSEDLCWRASDDPASKRVTLHLPSLLGVYEVPEWNDDPERTKEDVLALLRASITRAREAEAT